MKTKQAVQWLKDKEAQNVQIRRGNASIRHTELYVSDAMSQFTESLPISDKIKEIQDYLRLKILTGEFETMEICSHYARIIIDGEYKFSIWTANNLQFCEPYYNEPHFMVLDKFTEEEIQIMNPIMSKIVMDNLEKTKAANILRLESELAELKGVTP